MRFILVLLIIFLKTILFSQIYALTKDRKKVILNSDGTWKYFEVSTGNNKKLENSDYIDTKDGVTVTITNAGIIKTYTDEKYAGIRMRVKNNSSKTVISLTVVIYYLDRNGKAIFEEEFYPVLYVKNQIYYSRPNKKLKPNYSILSPADQNKYSTAKGLNLKEWDEGRVRIKIKEIKYEK